MRTTALPVAGLLGLALLAPTSWAAPATAAGETCRGEAATIVGTPNKGIVGTEGRDVIVTNRSQDVAALGGNDLICITGPDQRRGYRPVEIDAGPGDDVVDGTAAPDWPMSGRLGTGSDTFHGGEGVDDVDAGALSDDFTTYVDTDHDLLVGGGGDDTFSSGQGGQPNTDTIDLGSGRDYVTYAGVASGGSTVTGGSGRDDVLSVSTDARAIDVDNATGRLAQDGRQTLTWTDMEAFTVWSTHDDPVALVFTGTDADEQLVTYTASGVVDVVLGGGRDEFTTSSVLLTGSTVAAGPGRDHFYAMDRDRSLSLDMQKGRLSTTDGSGTHVADVTSFEDADVHAEEVVLKGTNAGNDLGVSACRGTVVGRGGDDFLGRRYDHWFETGPGCKERYTMDGGSGADGIDGYGGNDRLDGGTGKDVLAGKNGADRLVGGPGRDRADGGPGRDSCAAEREKRCER
nr:hypothetical protein [uncultured Nocardioides sp.]